MRCITSRSLCSFLIILSILYKTYKIKLLIQNEHLVSGVYSNIHLQYTIVCLSTACNFYVYYCNTV
jgi:hypothetical protein